MSGARAPLRKRGPAAAALASKAAARSLTRIFPVTRRCHDVAARRAAVRVAAHPADAGVRGSRRGEELARRDERADSSAVKMTQILPASSYTDVLI